MWIASRRPLAKNRSSCSSSSTPTISSGMTTVFPGCCPPSRRRGSGPWSTCTRCTRRVGVQGTKPAEPRGTSTAPSASTPRSSPCTASACETIWFRVGCRVSASSSFRTARRRCRCSMQGNAGLDWTCPRMPRSCCSSGSSGRARVSSFSSRCFGTCSAKCRRPSCWWAATPVGAFGGATWTTCDCAPGPWASPRTVASGAVTSPRRTWRRCMPRPTWSPCRTGRSTARRAGWSIRPRPWAN